jgi:hypothetical protein
VSKISLEGKKNPPQRPNSLSANVNQLLRQLFRNFLLRQKEFLTSYSQRLGIISGMKCSSVFQTCHLALPGGKAVPRASRIRTIPPWNARNHNEERCLERDKAVTLPTIYENGVRQPSKAANHAESYILQGLQRHKTLQTCSA